MTKEDIFYRLDHAAKDIINMAKNEADHTRAEIANTDSVRHLSEMVLMRRSYLGLLSDEVNIAQMLLLDEHDGGTYEDTQYITTKVNEVKQAMTSIANDLECTRIKKIKQLKKALT